MHARAADHGCRPAVRVLLDHHRRQVTRDRVGPRRADGCIGLLHAPVLAVRLLDKDVQNGRRGAHGGL